MTFAQAAPAKNESLHLAYATTRRRGTDLEVIRHAAKVLALSERRQTFSRRQWLPARPPTCFGGVCRFCGCDIEKRHAAYRSVRQAPLVCYRVALAVFANHLCSPPVPHLLYPMRTHDGITKTWMSLCCTFAARRITGASERQMRASSATPARHASFLARSAHKRSRRGV